jgi:hypothetical protein
MKEQFDKFYGANKELVDQSAHFAVGLCVVILLAQFVNIYIGFLVMMGAAALREVYQHKFQNKALGAGSVLDLSMFANGGLIGWIFL